VRGGGWYVAPRQRIERTVLWDKHDLKSGVTAQIERGERWGYGLGGPKKKRPMNAKNQPLTVVSWLTVLEDEVAM